MFGALDGNSGTGRDIAALSDADPEFSGSCGRCYEGVRAPAGLDAHGQGLHAHGQGRHAGILQTLRQGRGMHGDAPARCPGRAQRTPCTPHALARPQQQCTHARWLLAYAAGLPAAAGALPACSAAEPACTRARRLANPMYSGLAPCFAPLCLMRHPLHTPFRVLPTRSRLR
jgi:hypothetical protein